MSRCFQFPPRGFVWNGVSGDDLKNLIEKIKIEATRAKLQKKKEKKRQKKNSGKSTLTDESGKRTTPNSSQDSTANSHSINNKRPYSPTCDECTHCPLKKHKKTDSAAQSLSRSASFEQAAEIESQLRALLLNWIPTTIELRGTEPSDVDWLLGRSASCAKNSSQVRNVNSTLEPLVYAHPYTILF